MMTQQTKRELSALRAAIYALTHRVNELESPTKLVVDNKTTEHLGILTYNWHVSSIAWRKIDLSPSALFNRIEALAKSLGKQISYVPEFTKQAGYEVVVPPSKK